MRKRSPKTEGTEWLYLSMASFNGSGYADKSSPESYYQSYLLYKAWKKHREAIDMAKKFETEARFYAEKLCEANDAGHIPSNRKLREFEAFCNRAVLL